MWKSVGNRYNMHLEQRQNVGRSYSALRIKAVSKKNCLLFVNWYSYSLTWQTISSHVYGNTCIWWRFCRAIFLRVRKAVLKDNFKSFKVTQCSLPLVDKEILKTLPFISRSEFLILCCIYMKFAENFNDQFNWLSNSQYTENFSY